MDVLPRSAWTDKPHAWGWRGRLDPAKVNCLFLHWPGDKVRSHAGKTVEQVAEAWRGYHRHHTKTRGWSDIGYCKGIDLAGRLWDLGGEYVAAHSATDVWEDANERGPGVILLLGTDDVVSPEMAATLRAYRDDRRKVYPRMDLVLPHGRVPGADTDCPGGKALDWLAGGPSPDGFYTPAIGRITSEYGPRVHPITGDPSGFHRGFDIAPPIPGQRGVPVRAAYGGTVRDVGRNPNADRNYITGTWNSGTWVLVDGRKGSEWYGHLDRIDVRRGQKIKAGHVLGTMGDKGNVSGVHLHFETWTRFTPDTHHNPRIDFEHYGVIPGVGYPARLLDGSTAVGGITHEEEDDMFSDADRDKLHKNNHALGRLDRKVPALQATVEVMGEHLARLAGFDEDRFANDVADRTAQRLADLAAEQADEDDAPVEG